MFLVFVVVSLIFAGAYAAIMVLYLRGWRQLPVGEIPPDCEPQARVTVVIPARNEAANIGACLHSILSGSYPPHLLDIIVVDDHSDDGTAAVAANTAELVLNTSEVFKDLGGVAAVPRVRILALADFLAPGEVLNSHKKKALEIAIAQAEGEVIVQTDADCVVGRDWLRYMTTGLSSCGPVLFHAENSLFERFQSLDFLGLMGITGAGIQLGFQRMGNGANLAYSKAVFDEVGGFGGSEHLASGDDMFLIQKIARRYPAGIGFVKNRAAAVQTRAKPDWHAFVQQRIRWGTKNAALPEGRVKAVLAVVFLYCWLIVGSLVYGIFDTGALLLPMVLLAIKALADYVFLRELCRFFGREDLLRYFWPSFFLHIVYIAGVGTASLFLKQYEWKGRRVR